MESFRNKSLRFSMQEINEHDVYDSDPYTQRRIEKVWRIKWKISIEFVSSCFQALNLQSAIAEEAKERSRQVAGEFLELNLWRKQKNRRILSTIFSCILIIDWVCSHDDFFSFQRFINHVHAHVLGWASWESNAPLILNYYLVVFLCLLELFAVFRIEIHSMIYFYF